MNNPAIIVTYTTEIAETVNATLDFINNRPLVKFTVIAAKICCSIMIIAYLLKAIYNILTIHDMLVLLFAITWLFAYRRLNTILLQKILTKRNSLTSTKQYQLTSTKISEICKQQTINHHPWKSIKFIYQNNDGYLIPITGSANAGKFIWLPNRGFSSTQAKTNFLTLLQHHNIRIK